MCTVHDVDLGVVLIGVSSPNGSGTSSHGPGPSGTISQQTIFASNVTDRPLADVPGKLGGGMPESLPRQVVEEEVGGEVHVEEKLGEFLG